MRISEWSSDRCSSDLIEPAAFHDAALDVRRDERRKDVAILTDFVERHLLGRERDLVREELEAEKRVDLLAILDANQDRKSAVQGKRVSVRVDMCGSRKIKRKNIGTQNIIARNK